MKNSDTVMNIYGICVHASLHIYIYTHTHTLQSLLKSLNKSQYVALPNTRVAINS